MGRVSLVALLCLSIGALMVNAGDPYLFYEWKVTYGTIAPLGVPKQVILINGQFPGPRINATSNNNIIVNVFNELDEPFLLSWNGIQQRKNSWMDGTSGTMCPIAPGNNQNTLNYQRPNCTGAFQSVAKISYVGGTGVASPVLPLAPPETFDWSVNQFRSFRWNLTASAARPNPQGSYHYGSINITRTLKLSSSRAIVNGKLRYALNGVSHSDSSTPVKLQEYFGLARKTFQYNLMQDQPAPVPAPVVVAPNVVNATFRNFVEIIFENTENTMQSYHLDGYSFFAVAIEAGTWSPVKRSNYNLVDAVSRNNIQVYPHSWAAVMTTLDNAGMWNLRSELWERFYLGQQLYLSLLSPNRSDRDEYNMSEASLLCGAVQGLPKPAPYA